MASGQQPTKRVDVFGRCLLAGTFACLSTVLLLGTSFFTHAAAAQDTPIANTDTATKRPNIIWIIGEDMGPDLGCYGVNVHTPNLDKLARQGMRFTHCFGTASVCMPNRTAMATGVTQTTLGAVTMRPPTEFMRPLSGGIEPLPNVLRKLGYFTANIRDKQLGTSGKDDWNFQFDGKAWDTRRLKDLQGREPFYAQFTIPVTHRPFRKDADCPVDPATVALPPYYPDHPVARQSWADYLESIQYLDRSVGRILAWLEREGVADSTIVFFTSDHGEAFLRGKYFLYDCSLNQPLIVYWPEACGLPADFEPGTTSDRLIAGIDLTAQTVVCAGGRVPQWMHGRTFIGPDARSRSEIYSAADWYGGGQLKSRSIRTERYKYIRNFNTALSVLTTSTEYRKAMHPMYHLVELMAERGQLSDLHRRLLVEPLPKEELYDLAADPHELKNLAADADHAELVQRLRAQVDTWIKASGDRGFEQLAPEHVKFFQQYKANQSRKLKEKQDALRQSVAAAINETPRN